jgi:acyl-CoA oxidase
MKFISLDKEGNFEVKGDLRILYSVMLFIRVTIIVHASDSLAEGLTIAGRYAAVRRQFSSSSGTKLETKLLDYQTHMFKLLPLLAHAYSQRFVGQQIWGKYEDLMKGVEKNDFSGLDVFHHLASGFKATFT